jgi:hypothetical protein
LELKTLAQEAYIWLFEEKPGHPNWEERQVAALPVRQGDGSVRKEVGALRITAFLVICDLVGLDPDKVREHARTMTIKSIMHAGRPAEHRRPSQEEAVSVEEHTVFADVDFEKLDREGTYTQRLVDYA